MHTKKWFKPVVAIVILLLVFMLFAYYIVNHQQIITNLEHINPWLLAVLLMGYVIMLFWLMNVYNATLELCSQPLAAKENLLLTIYSTLANFFLPLQSGPGVRAAYLNKRHKVNVSSYILSILVYLGIYAIISAGLLFVASNYWLLAIPSIIVAAIISYYVITITRSRLEKKTTHLTLHITRSKLLKLTIVTLGQIITQAMIYGVELNSLHIPITIRRVISYTGAANFSLYVSLTPGAIGFREAFLEFSQQIHHFSTNAIIAANIIDRGVFLLFLAILFIVLLITHTKDRLKL